MPIFTQSLQKIDAANPADAIKKMAGTDNFEQAFIRVVKGAGK